jgi:uncharacterized protein (TIGR00251 family)
VRLRVRPAARADAILGVRDGALHVSVTAPPDRGRANDAVVALLARVLGVPRSRVVLAGGGASRSKTIVVSLDADSVRKRLEGEVG